MKISLFAASLALALPVFAQTTPPLTSGIDTSAFDASVRAQDDFYGHINGKWMQSTQIPASKAAWGTYLQLRETAQEQVRTVLDEVIKSPGAVGSETHKIADLYLSFIDDKARNTQGVKPLQADLARIAALRDKKELPALMAYLGRTGVTTPFSLSVYQDAKDATRYAVYASQDGLGLPDRDYYLQDDDTRLKAARVAYLAHVEKLLGMGGEKAAAGHAADILALETALAKVQWTRVESRDALKTYNPIFFKKLAELAPGFDWEAWAKASGIAGKTDYLVVRQPSYFTGMANLVKDTPLQTWKSYFTWHVLASYAPYLSNAFVDERFAFTGKTLRGVPENEPQWQLARGFVDGAMGEAVGKLYVAKFFPPENKARVLAMVANFLATFRDGINTLEWMGPETKKEALAKLATFRPNIGYPDRWRDYSALKTHENDLIANVRASRDFAYQYNINKLGQPVDRGEWSMTPQTVNAQYSSLKNAITFPAALLQPPFFNVKAEDAVNYGAVGTSIGHEISHGFDDQGSQYDGLGNLRNWWTPEDRKAFTLRAAGLVQQYSLFSPVPGYFVNGKLTLGENIGDNSGVAIAYKAYKKSLGGKPSPVIDGMTGEQRLYIGFGIKYRNLQREDAAIMQIKTDPHSPGEFRVKGTVVNQPGFFEAFDVKPGDRMYLSPEQRVIMW
jgi:predicted metalloendopeptidase